MGGSARAEPRRDRFDGVCEVNRLICREHYLLRVRFAHGLPPTEPGQFVQIGCRVPDLAIDEAQWLGGDVAWEPDRLPSVGQAELCQRTAVLRRPFSIAGRGDDEGGTWIDLIHRVVGIGTEWLAGLRPGDAVDVIGPLGNRFELTEGKSLALLVGGGVGLPPMFYLAEALHRAGWDAVAWVGALSRDLLAVTFNEGCAFGADGELSRAVAEFSRHGYPAVITTDDGSLGLRGRITDGLSRYFTSLSEADAGRAVVFTCGPEPMMHAVAKLASQAGVDCQVCVEQAMACGMGTCQSCVVKTDEQDHPHGTTADGRAWRYRLACTDGPVFPASAVVW